MDVHILNAEGGAQPFLQQFEKYQFNSAQFEGEPRVTLFDKASGFLVCPPRIDAKPARFVHRARKADENLDDEDPPFRCIATSLRASPIS